MEMVSRRRFLVFGVAATGLLASAYAGLRQVGRYPESDLPLVNLGRKEAEIVRVLGAWTLPPAFGMPSGGDDRTVLGVDRFLSVLPEEKRRLAVALPLAFEHGSALDRFGARRMTVLPEDRRDEYLRGWAESTNPVVTQLWIAWRSILGMPYFDRPDVIAAMGFRTACGGSS